MKPDDTLTIHHWPPTGEDLHNLFQVLEQRGERVGEVHMSPEVMTSLSPHKRLEWVWNALVCPHPELEREVQVLSYVGNPCAERIYVASLVFQVTPP